jgi:hypothetical protein
MDFQKVRSFCRSLLLAGAFVVAAVAQPSAAQDSALGGFERCIYGTASDADAEEVGLTLGRRFPALKFDASIFSDACANKILARTFGAYDEITSLKVVGFFWRDAFLSRLLEVSLSTPGSLSCNLSCLLSRDPMPLPTLSLFQAVIRDLPRLSPPDNIFLPAKALFTAQKIAPERMSELLGSIANISLRDNVIRVLYWLSDANFIRNTFRDGTDPAQICLAEKCIAIAPANNPTNCDEIYRSVTSARRLGGLGPIVALKFWAMNSGKDLVQDCVRRVLAEPVEQAGPKIIVFASGLFVFDPSLNAADVVNNFKSGVFKDFSFMDKDISELSNIEVSRIRTMSSSFARRMVDQLAVDPAALRAVSDNQKARDLIEQSPSGARFKLLLCERNVLPISASCSREGIYLAAIRELLN